MRKQFIKYVSQNMLGMLGMSLYILADTYFISRAVGPNGIAALNLVLPLYNLIFAIGAMIGIGSAIRFVVERNKKNPDAAGYFFHALAWAGIISILFIMVGIFLPDKLVALLGGDATIVATGTSYTRIFMLFTPFFMWNHICNAFVRICGGGIFFIVAYNVLAAIFRGFGDSKSPLIFVAVACVVNIIGDLILVAGFHLDTAGAAIATVAAQAVSVILAIIILKKKNYGFHIKKRDFKINKQCKRFVRVGLPLALQEFLTQMSFLALCAFINKLGLEASSGYGVACKIVNFAMLVPSALMQSMASFVSQNVGAGKNERARKSMFTGMGVGLVVGAVVFICVWNFGDYLTSIFTTDSAVIQKGAEYLRGFAPETIVTAILFSMVGFFNGNEKTVWVMIQGLIQTLLVRLPLAYIMSIQPHASLTKIGLAAPVATCFGIVLNVIFYIVFVRKNTCRIKKK